MGHHQLWKLVGLRATKRGLLEIAYRKMTEKYYQKFFEKSPYREILENSDAKFSYMKIPENSDAKFSMAPQTLKKITLYITNS